MESESLCHSYAQSDSCLAEIPSLFEPSSHRQPRLLPWLGRGIAFIGVVGVASACLYGVGQLDAKKSDVSGLRAFTSFWADGSGRCMTFGGVDQVVVWRDCTDAAPEQELFEQQGLLRWQANRDQCLTVGSAPGQRFPILSAACSRQNLGQLWQKKEGNLLLQNQAKNVCIFYSSHDNDPVWGGPCVDGQLGRPTPINELHEGWAIATPEEHQIQVEGEYAEAGAKLFCFMAVLPNSFEVQLRKVAEQRGAGIFACDSNKVYDSTPCEEVHQGDWNSFANVESFIKVWRQVLSDGFWRDADWVIKTDPDTVWMPDRLHSHLQALRPPANTALYIKNSELAFGFLAPLEILSNGAVAKFEQTIDYCEQAKGTGKMGEDGWLKGCMDAGNVEFLSDTTILKSSFDVNECSTDSQYVAFHPHKKVWTWSDCLDRMR